MHQIIQSPAARYATATVGGETGLLGNAAVSPVLCCPVVAVAGVAVKAALAAGAYAATNNNDSGDTAVLQTTYAAAYIAPGRITTSAVALSDDASVEELIGAQRA